MARRVLYFPYISVPQTEWFVRVLLYWDQVGSIVPVPYAADLDRVSPFMSELTRAELVRPIVPAEHEGELYGAMSPFFAFLDSDPELKQRAARGLGSTAARRGRADPGTVSQIHGEKLGHVIGYELVERGLARPAKEGRWFEVESRAASAFMAYLAAALGALPDVSMDPITDDAVHLAPFGRGANGDATSRLELARDLRLAVLERVLPGPNEPVSASELITFKEKHGERLSAFRRTLESQILDLALVDDSEIRAAKLQLFNEQLADDLSELEAKMRARKWPRLVFGALCGVVSTAIPVAAAAAAGALPVAAAGVPGLAGAIYSAHSVLSDRQDYLHHPLAYAALAHERLA